MSYSGTTWGSCRCRYVYAADSPTTTDKGAGWTLSSSARRRARRIAWLPPILVIAAVLSIGACSGGNPVPATEESVAIGASLFENNCQVCHGVDGKGSSLAPDLTMHLPTRADGFLFGRISEGFPVDSTEQLMPAFNDQLTETERWHLVNFLRDAFSEGKMDPVLPGETSP